MDTQSTNINNDNGFGITENAARQISELQKKESSGAILRLSVDGGGCSGFQYKYEFVTSQNSDDKVFTKDGAKLVIDEISLGFLGGSVLDYIETLGSEGFEIKNPKATATCGCGNSFSV